MFVFLDEAGDLGFDFSKEGTSKTFTITLLICQKKETLKAIEKAVKRTLKNKINAKKKKSRLVQELKGNATGLDVKVYFLRQMPDDDWEIFTIVVHKANVFDYLKTKHAKPKLYNFIAKELLGRIGMNYRGTQTVNLIVDRCKDGDGRKDFDTYIKAHLETSFPIETEIYITHEDSHSSAGLQAVDMFCWGVQRKANLGDTEWYGKFSNFVSRYRDYLKK